MQHKFPFVSLHIQMEGNDLDVNVHPSKMEVRFARGTEVYDAVYETVHKALTTREMIQTVPFGKEEPVKKLSSVVKPGDVPEPFEMKRRAEMPEYRTQVANTVNRTSNVSIKGNDRTVSAPDTAMDKKTVFFLFNTSTRNYHYGGTGST